MAAVLKTIVPSLGVSLPCNAHRVPNQSLVASEALAAGDSCYINADGTVYRTNGTAAAPAALSDGIVLLDVALGGPVTLFTAIECSYGPASLVPGTRLYVDTVLGGLNTAPTVGGTIPVAKVVYVNITSSTPHAVIRFNANR